ncbi:MAG: TAXI family TRAP transporter solute-binding subunit [Verrucomicrobiota bacterium]
MLHRESFREPSVIYGIVAVAMASLLLLGFLLWWRSHIIVYRLTLSAGAKDGMYYPMALEIQEMVRRSYPRIRINVVTSEGSQQNLQRLLDEPKKYDLALVQNDTQPPVRTDESPRPKNGDAQIRTLTPLHVDVLHIVVRDIGIQNLQDLRGHAIAVGKPGSGSRPLTEELFKHYGLTMGKDELHEMSLKKATLAIQKEEIDAFLFAVGMQSDTMFDCMTCEGVHFLPLGKLGEEGSEMDGFLLRYPFAENYVIPKMSYGPGIEGSSPVPAIPIPALAVRNHLVSRESLPIYVARAVTETIHRKRSTQVQEIHTASQITEDFDRS